jgi:hypothetical protein
MITANIARKMAFEKVNTTYDECFNEFMNSITEHIEENAKKGQLDIHLSLDFIVKKYFKNVKSDNLNETLKEIIKERFTKLGFVVQYVRYSYSNDATLIISW